MKKLIFYTAILLIGCTGCGHRDGNISKQTRVTAYSDAEGTCLGDKSCRACKNCTKCKHCSKEGGNCGVCK